MIIQCEECGRDVSTEATACPSCGFPRSPPNPESQKRSHAFGWIALIAVLMSSFIPAITAPLVVLAGIVFALLEIGQGGRVFGGIVLALGLLQVWAIADHFGGISGSLGLTSPDEIEQQTARKYAATSLGVRGDAQQIIQSKCAEEWPRDYRMQKYCLEQQNEGISKLLSPTPADIDQDAAKIMRGKCVEEWPRDFKMQAYCESQQREGYRALRFSSRGTAQQARCAQKWPDDYRMREYCERN